MLVPQRLSKRQRVIVQDTQGSLAFACLCISHTDACMPKSGWGRKRVTGGGSAVIYSLSTVVRPFAFPAAGDAEPEFEYWLSYWDSALTSTGPVKVCVTKTVPGMVHIHPGALSPVWELGVGGQCQVTTSSSHGKDEEKVTCPYSSSKKAWQCLSDL